MKLRMKLIVLLGIALPLFVQAEITVEWLQQVFPREQNAQKLESVVKDYPEHRIIAALCSLKQDVVRGDDQTVENLIQRLNNLGEVNQNDYKVPVPDASIGINAMLLSELNAAVYTCGGN